MFANEPFGGHTNSDCPRSTSNRCHMVIEDVDVPSSQFSEVSEAELQAIIPEAAEWPCPTTASEDDTPRVPPGHFNNH
ncbi:hypothetical protein MJO28_003189 [Puccinia striiformis f. sp. tritici]|uniref:Uncharacterized protein n=1 Tax=Puccinia striiformis f. sp. tritici TaxID=168172 RepID=A0ACC0ET58_9BASI|nr:hypothetical protein MJO28_003189 [Puccinia striiformis f. sp. tritici]